MEENNMKFTEGMIVQMNITSLYKKFKQPTLGRIEYNDDGDFYMLFNENGEDACFDGEEVTIEQVGEHLITFRNDNGNGSMHFTLTCDEAEIAVVV